MSGKVVLLVDDSRVSRMITRKVIEVKRPGWTVVEAASGEEALEQLPQVKPDFVVLDVNMPGMGGMEAARRMKAFDPALAVTLLTANIQDPVRHQAEEIGVGFLNKPLRDEELLGFLGSDAP
ncbi:MAG TPA: response regulator [Magnetospirillum sp.]|nr:response regulator [Magnetospirillum sp.]